MVGSNDYRRLKGAARKWRAGKSMSDGEYRNQFVARFWMHVNKNGVVMRPELGPCWEWTGSLAHGYGQIGAVRDRLGLGTGNQPVRTHVAAWVVIYGNPKPAKGIYVCHECNNKKCVRESHLWAGTPADNVHHAQATGLVPKADWEERERQRLIPLDDLARRQREFIDRHLYLVSPHQQTILKLRYGYTHKTCLTLEEVGQKYQVTRERIRQLQERAEEEIFMLTIEKDIPIPKPKSLDVIFEAVEAFQAMNVGESFLVDRSMVNKVHHAARTRGYMITTRTVDTHTARVWLVSKPKSNAKAA